MHSSTITAQFHCKTLAVLLVLVILCAQWAGFAHRISHASLQQQTSVSGIEKNVGLEKSVEHSCQLFDATALAAVLHTPPYSSVALPGVQVLALWSAFASWDAPFICHFSSRAPPRA
jgi:hypothetical protein